MFLNFKSIRILFNILLQLYNDYCGKLENLLKDLQINSRLLLNFQFNHNLIFSLFHALSRLQDLSKNSRVIELQQFERFYIGF